MAECMLVLLRFFEGIAVHTVDPEAKPDRLAVEKYRQRADLVENAGYQRLATTLREWPIIMIEMLNESFYAVVPHIEGAYNKLLDSETLLASLLNSGEWSVQFRCCI